MQINKNNYLLKNWSLTYFVLTCNLYLLNNYVHYFVQVAAKVQIKQKLPFKLANKLSSSNSNSAAEPAVSNSVTSPSQSSYAFQQLLPLKLREGAKNPMNPVQGSPNEILSPSTQAPSHSRTGSSPAMMQSAQVSLLLQ